MERITIRVSSKQKAKIVLAMLKTMDFIDDIHAESEGWIGNREEYGQERVSDFFALAGIWEGRDIQQETLRQKAWPVRS